MFGYIHKIDAELFFSTCEERSILCFHNGSFFDGSYHFLLPQTQENEKPVSRILDAGLSCICFEVIRIYVPASELGICTNYCTFVPPYMYVKYK